MTEVAVVGFVLRQCSSLIQTKARRGRTFTFGFKIECWIGWSCRQRRAWQDPQQLMTTASFWFDLEV